MSVLLPPEPHSVLGPIMNSDDMASRRDDTSIVSSSEITSDEGSYWFKITRTVIWAGARIRAYLIPTEKKGAFTSGRWRRVGDIDS